MTVQQKIQPYSKNKLVGHLIRNVGIGLIIIGCSLSIGMWGYHHFEKMEWVDAYVNASMILSGMGPVGQLQTTEGKLFAGTYALFSGIIFLFICGVIFLPLIHYFLHKFHIQDS